MATFAVDDGFAYLVPDDLSDVTVGSIVRVPLGGRRVRGFVTAIAGRGPDRTLRSVTARSGALPVFDDRLLSTARWAATHYVAPLAVVLAAIAPPNLPRSVAAPVLAPLTPASRERRGRPRYLVSGGDHLGEISDLVIPALASGGNAMVVAATVAECEELAAGLSEALGPRVIPVTSSLGGGALTTAWSTLAGHGGLVAVGTRELAMWPCRDLAAAVVVEEGRPAMKAKQTPTLHVRDVLRRRSTVERFSLAFLGPVPTLEAVAAGVEVVEPKRRVWPLVEVADRNDEGPGAGVVGERARAAITAVSGGGGRVFVLVPRRVGAFACARCGTIRRCSTCGAAAGRTGSCERDGTSLAEACECGGDRFRPLGASIGRVVDDLARAVGSLVGEVGSARAVTVGTERDLVGVRDQDLAVAVDLDGSILAPNYRAAEDALRLGARLAATVGGGRSRRCLVQTSIPDHPVIVALRRGGPMDFLRAELALREESRLPPVGELIAVEVWDGDLGHADRVLRQAGEGAAVRGPAAEGRGGRWLIQGGALHEVRLRLRPVVQRLRDGGASVRVDADPVDL